jgi:SAM-dependent methyltransferase
MEEAVITLSQIIDEKLLVCPRCRGPLCAGTDAWRCESADCQHGSDPFPVVSGLPALIDFDSSVLEADRLQIANGASEVRRSAFGKRLRKVFRRENSIAPVQVARMLAELCSDPAGDSVRRPRVLVVGGGVVGDGLQDLYTNGDVDVVAFDIYVSPSVQFVGDAHGIPLADECVDGVIIQAVLEHVLDPQRVAAEVERVLKPGGIVYADTPFMQQVHEGPYDFTRFTESGHRYLFRRFERIDSGSVAGAGTALMWSIDYFVRALTHSRLLGRIAAVCFIWLSYADRMLDPKHSVDGASSVFFLGRKTDIPMSQSAIIAHYLGGMPAR